MTVSLALCLCLTAVPVGITAEPAEKLNLPEAGRTGFFLVPHDYLHKETNTFHSRPI
jgi:hypothetical protein